MSERRPASLLKSLNFKIVIYFIAFAYFPLLVFSVLGYYINKDMITRINLENLRSLNLNYANRIKAYLDFNQDLLAKFNNTKQYFEGSDFESVFMISDETRSEIYNPSGSDPDIKHAPYLESHINNAIKIRGYFSARKLQELLYNDSQEIQVSLIFSNQKVQIFADDDGNKRQFHEFDQEAKLKTLANRESWFIYNEASGVFSDYTYFSDQKIVVVTQIDVNTFYAELDTFLNKILLANGMLALILLGLALYYSRQITTPIHKLIKAVQHIGKGNLDYKIKVSTNDEIQILATEFELMREKLQESYQRMEEKISLRTEELQGAQAQIMHQEKMASLGLMAAGIAHEIGNPLTSISSMAQIIKRKNTDDKTLEYVSNILKNIDRISRIVRELVDFSKPTTHKAAPSDINEIITSAVGIIKYDRRSKNIRYALDLDIKLPKVTVVADHLMQVFLNILINAVDASEGVGEEITVSSHSENNNIVIVFKDEGCGIPQESLNRIFEPFYTTKDVGKGTGLGLTVSYGLIKKFKGEITVSSILNKGSVFTIRLPIIAGGN
jgi:signal transduction histidine kinase